MKTNTKISFLARTARLARATGARAAMTLLLLLVTTTTARAAVSGFVDIVWEHNGSIEVSGWTYDTEYVDTPIGVHVQIWDYYGNTLIKTVGFPANIHRDDVGNKGFHGFVPIENEGTYMVKIAAMGVSGSDYLISSSGAGNTFYATPGAPWIISYDANGGWNAPAPQTNHWGIPSSLSTAQPTRPGYTFTGWNTAADGTGEAHTSGYTYNFFWWQNNVTLYAQWTPTYTVTYNANGGSGAPAAQEKIHDIPLVLSTALPSHVGYYFTGWNTAANGSGIAYSPGATYTGNAALTLYAQWTKTSVSYLAYNTGTKAYETRTANNWSEVTSTTSTMGAANTETWYLVNSNVTDWSRIEVLGTVHLILADGYSLRAEKGIHVPTGATLNIYGQSGGTGELHGFATTDGQAGIGGNYEETGGTLTIHGGSIEAIGYRWGAGIGGGRYGNGGHITIYGGTINATGGQTGAGIGGGWGANCGTVTIIGGTVIAQAQTAYDGDNSQAIGSGAGTGISDGSLIIDNIKVYSSAEAANPVAPANRLSTCQSKYARLVPCTAHNYVNGACTICGVYLPLTYLAYQTSTHTFVEQTVMAPLNGIGAGTSVIGADNTERWYVVSNDVTLSSRLEIRGSVHLILRDGKTMNVIRGIAVNEGNSLTIYGQSGGTGALNADAVYVANDPGVTNRNAGIGSNYQVNAGNITIHGGRITAYGAAWSAGIGGGMYGGGGSVTIYGGTINARGHEGSSEAIGHGSSTDAVVTKTLADGLRVFLGNSPVDYGNRMWCITQNSNVVTIAPCTEHNPSNFRCTWCGTILYGIIYNGNKATSGTEPASFTEYQTGQTVTVLGNTGNLERTGYTFSGWNTAANGSGTDYAPGTTFSFTSSVTLYAKWTLNDYSITYDLAGGTVATPNPTSYTIESDAITLNNPTRDGYVFTGWTGTGLAEPTMTVTIPKGSTGNRAYTATWTAPIGSIDYVYSHNGSISFGGWAYEESNPSTPIPVQVQIWSGENFIKTVEFMANNPREDLGYNCGFTGVIPLDEGTYKVKIMAVGTTSVYLVWPGVGSDLYPQVGTPWYISYDANGGTGAPEPQTNHWAVPSTLSTVQPTRPGYTFTGWNTIADGSGVPYPSGYTDNFFYWMSDRTLYAQWTLNTYTVAYNLAGGTVATDNPTAYTVLNEDITLNNPTREGYIFAGWTGTYLTEATMIVTIASGSTGNREYTATWTYDPNVQYNMYNPTTGTFEERWASNATLVTNSTTTMGADNTETWYELRDNATISSRIEVRGSVHLILRDGKTMNVIRGIAVNEGNSLTIYGQSGGTGALNADAVYVANDPGVTNRNAGIGSNYQVNAGNITIHGGRITANGAAWSAGIGGGMYGGGGSVTIYGGTINARGHDGSSEAIGHGSSTDAVVTKTLANGLRVFLGNSPVDYGYRMWCITQNSNVVTIAPCTEHNLSNNKCTYCGTILYGVTYDGNKATSGTVPASFTEYQTGQTVTILENTGNLERTGYTFSGWNTAANGSGTDYAPGTTFTISSSVTLYAQWSASLLTLANNADNSEAIGLASGDGMYYDVTLAGRTLYKDGDWNTLCLPFDLGNPEAEEGHYFDGTLLEGATVKTLGSTTFENNILTMTFVPATTIEAGKPYIIKWAGGDNLVEPAITGVIIPATYTSAEAIANALHAAACKTEYVDFVGTFSTVALQAGDKTKLYLASGNNLYYPDADMNINACRAYFQLNGLTAGDPVGGEAPVRAFVLNFGEEETGIVEMRNDEGEMRNENQGMRNADAWYDMQGRRLESSIFNSQSSIKKKGLYIHNGRKIVVK